MSAKSYLRAHGWPRTVDVSTFTHSNVVHLAGQSYALEVWGMAMYSYRLFELVLLYFLGSMCFPARLNGGLSFLISQAMRSKG